MPAYSRARWLVPLTIRVDCPFASLAGSTCSRPSQVQVCGISSTGPNPEGYVTRKGYIHKLIDGGVIERAHLTADRLPKDVPAMRIDDEKLFQQVITFIQSSYARMEEVYALEKRGAFESDSEHFAEGTALVADRLAAAGAMLAAIWDAAYRDAGTDPFRERRLRQRRDQPKQGHAR